MLTASTKTLLSTAKNAKETPKKTPKETPKKTPKKTQDTAATSKLFIISRYMESMSSKRQASVNGAEEF